MQSLFQCLTCGLGIQYSGPFPSIPVFVEGRNGIRNVLFFDERSPLVVRKILNSLAPFELDHDIRGVFENLGPDLRVLGRRVGKGTREAGETGSTSFTIRKLRGLESDFGEMNE